MGRGLPLGIRWHKIASTAHGNGRIIVRWLGGFGQLVSHTKETCHFWLGAMDSLCIMSAPLLIGFSQMSDLLFDQDSLAGPVDLEALKSIERSHVLDPSYRQLVHAYHGGIPLRQYIKGKGSRYRVGRFLTILNHRSILRGEFQPHFDQVDMDCRVVRSISSVSDSESSTSRALFYGQRLLPFAAMYAGEEHPDEMCLDRGYVSFVCFDYGVGTERPPIVIWHSDQAMEAYGNWEANGCPRDDKDEEIPLVDYSAFTERIADNFDEFIALLQSDPE